MTLFRLHLFSMATCIRVAFVLTFQLCAAPGFSAYLLGSGDVLHISVYGAQEFGRRVTVNVDGEISLPFLGEVRAAGISVTDLRKSVAGGLDAASVIRNPQVTVEVVEHRPFFVTGDVSKPGALPYRPDLKVRHAIALAGGYDALRFRSDNPLLAAPELRSQHETLWADLVRKQVQLASLQAELDDTTEMNLTALESAPVPKQLISEIINLEQKNLAVRLEDFRKEKEFLRGTASQIRTDISTLEAALKEQEAAVKDQASASEQVSSQFARGVSSAMRVGEESRALILLRGQQVDTATRLAQTRRQHDELHRRLEQAIDQREARLLREIEETIVSLNQVRSQIQATGEKLLYTGTVNARSRGGGGGPEIVIYRRSEAGQQRMVANEDADVLPGDVIDVVIRPDQAAALPNSQRE